MDEPFGGMEMERLRYWMYKVDEYATVLAPWLFVVLLLICMNCCSAYKEIPVQYVDRVEYRDSTVYVTDTITVEIPKEVIREIVPEDTTSILRTSVAVSEAKIKKGMLHHRLEQNGVVKTRIDTVITVQYVDRYIEKEVPVEVEKIKYKYDNLFWVSIGLNGVMILLFFLKIYLKRT